MFNMFRKKEQESFGLKNTEKYTPAFLPKNVEDGHTDLSTFIVGDYSLLNDAFLAARYAECESKLSPLVQISDEFTLGDMGDSYVNAEWEFVKNKHEEEVAMHDLSGKNILKARAVRIQELQERIPKIKEKIIKRQQRIDALSDKHAKHAIRIGKIMIQLGLPITALAFVADFFVNTEFVQSILYSNANMLRILVVCLCLMSDGTMYALGSMVSKKSDTQATVLYRILFTAFGGEGGMGKESDYQEDFVNSNKHLPVSYDDDAQMAEYLMVSTIVQSITVMKRRLRLPSMKKVSNDVLSKMVEILQDRKMSIDDRYYYVNELLKEEDLDIIG